MTSTTLHTAASGTFWQIAGDVLLDAVLDTLKIIPFLFLTYLLMEFLEHHAGERLSRGMKKAGRLAPLAGGALGIVPQCGFSAMAAGLYAGGVVSVGTLLAVFLATSDEMLPVLLAGAVPLSRILVLLAIKLTVAVAVGLAAEFLLGNRKKHQHTADLCEAEHCGCERGIVRSALRHTLHISLFILIINLALGALFATVQEEQIAHAVGTLPFLRECLGALVGLIPNCGASVALATLYAKGVIPAGVLLAGLLPGAGTGLLVLARTNRPVRETVWIIALLFAMGVAVGVLFDLTPLSELLLL